MIDRINMLLKAKNISVSQFTQAIKIQRSGMSHILSGRNKPSLEFVLRVLKRYPEINPSWLLMGEGEMYISDKKDMQTTMFPTQQDTDYNKQTSYDEEQNPTTPLKDTEKPKETIEVETDTICEKPKSKTIEKIIVLYSDNTFDEYLKG